MGISKLQQDELEPGLLGPVTLICSLLGTGQTRVKMIEGGQHPKMRLISGNGSGAFCITKTSAGAHIVIEHDDGRNAGVSSDGLDADNTMYDWEISTVKDDDIFEADEPVYMYPVTAAATATDAALIVAMFEVLKE